MQTIGTIRDVQLDVEQWDSVTAEVELAISGMFLREMPGGTLAGGLMHLDQAMQGALIALRTDGIFSGREGETLLLTSPPKPIVACAVLLVGLGEPTEWSNVVARRVAATAMTEALRLRARTVAFAPGLLDSGLTAAGTAGTGGALLDGVIDALETAAPRSIDPATGSPWMKRWIFDAGGAHFAQVAQTFQTAFDARA